MPHTIKAYSSEAVSNYAKIIFSEGVRFERDEPLGETKMPQPDIIIDLDMELNAFGNFLLTKGQQGKLKHSNNIAKLVTEYLNQKP